VTAQRLACPPRTQLVSSKLAVQGKRAARNWRVWGYTLDYLSPKRVTLRSLRVLHQLSASPKRVE